MPKTPEEAHDDLVYVREAIEYQSRMVCEHLPPWLAALTALYLLVAVVSRYYLDDATGDLVGNISMFSMGALLLVFLTFNARKKKARGVNPQVSARVVRGMLMPMLGMMGALLVLFAARSELGLIGDPFRVAGLLIVGMTMLGVGVNGPALAATMGVGMVLGALAIVYGQFMLLGVFLAGSILIGSWIDSRRVGKMGDDLDD